MESNPYQSPATSSVNPRSNIPMPSGSGHDSEGMWRDGKILVVSLYSHHFPERCVKTNRPNDGNTEEVQFEFVPNVGVWVGLFGVIGAMIAKSLYGKKTTLRLPISRDAIDDEKEKTTRMWMIGIVAILMVIGGFAGLIIEILWLALMIPVGVFGGLIACFVSGMPNKLFLKVHKIDEQFIWLKDADPLFLDSLPDWPN